MTRNKPFGQQETEFPLAPNAHIVSRIHSIDLGVKAETLTISTFQTGSMNKTWYQSTLTRAGWKLQPSGIINESQHKLGFQKGQQACQLTFIDKSPIKQHRSMILIHWVKG